MSLLEVLKMFVAITITLGASNAAAGSNSTNSTSASNYIKQYDYHEAMLIAVNKERAVYGLPELCLNSKLRNAALLHARDMAAKSFLSHIGSDGSVMSSRVKAAGYHWTFVAENVAAGQANVANVVASWMQSKGHRANILSSKAKMFECGYAYSPSSKYKHYWTQSFASSSAENCN